MKLLGWVRHKLQNNSTEPCKDLTIGNNCTSLSTKTLFDDQDSQPKTYFGSHCSSRSLKCPKQLSENFYSGFKLEGVDKYFIDETSIVSNELFDGFFSIGTLGSEPVISEPATPTFTMPLENIYEDNIAVTENYLKVINDELGKFLEAEEEECNESSGRNSQVSTITLSGKPMEVTSAEDIGKTMVCPLQGYLLGSSIEVPETRIEVKKEKASLRELFHRTKLLDENPSEKCSKGEMQANKINNISNNPIKKTLKKLHASSKSSTTSSKTPGTAKKKLQKVIQMFHRKIHPESSLPERESKSCRLQLNNSSSNVSYINKGQIHQHNNKSRFSHGSNSKEGTLYHERKPKWPQYEKKEHWIKSDANYLVLEL